MLFDKFCGFVEFICKSDTKTDSSLRILIEAAQKAHLFVFPDAPHKFLPREMPVESAQALTNSFFLPFPTVAVEDEASCVILIDSEPNQEGWDKPRKFIDIRSLLPNPDHFNDDVDPELLEFFKREGKTVTQEEKDIYIITLGSIDKCFPVSNSVYETHGDVAACLIWDRKTIKPVPMDPIIRKNGIVAAKTAIEEVLFANTPNRFIVEKSAVKPRKPPKGRILRSMDRPQYTILKPGKIREIMGLPDRIPGDPTGRISTPHPIRKHKRTLRSERFVNKQWQTITIPASWVGPSESVVGNHKYKVLLDK